MLRPITQQQPPLVLDAVKAYLRIFDDSHDSTILLMRDAAIEAVETYTRQRFRVSTFRQHFVNQNTLTLSAFPVISITDLVCNGDELDTEEIAQCFFEPLTIPTVVYPPDADPFRFAKTTSIEYLAGWSQWPADLTLLILEKIAESFEFRGVRAPNVSNEFSRSHRMVLESYTTQHDCIR